jgi:hypothetical protein
MKYFLFIILILEFISCVSEKQEGLVVTDETVVSLAKNVSSFTYFKNSTDTLQTDPSSEHGLYMRVRMNSRALTAMNDSVSNAILDAFPDESMIVKEMYDARGGPLTGFVLIYKLHNGANQNHGWIWGEYTADGSTVYSVGKKGDRCLGCHMESTNVDLIRTFSLH